MSAALAAGLSIMGTGLNKMFNDDTNRMNEEIARDNRRWQKDMMMYQNEWNSPKNQRKLFEEAGINPYMALGNFGDSTSADAGNPDTPVMNPPDIQSGFNSAASAVLQDSAIELQKAQSEKAREEARSVGIDNQTKLLRDIATLETMYEDAKNKHKNTEYLEALIDLKYKEYEYQSAESQSRVGLNRANQAKAEKETQVLELERRLKEFDLQNIKPLEVRKLSREIDKISSEIAVNYKSLEVMQAQIENYAAVTAREWLNGLHQKYDNDIFEATKDVIIEQVSANLGLIQSQTDESRSRTRRNQTQKHNGVTIGGLKFGYDLDYNTSP